MAPIMWALWWLVISADRLHAWRYSDNFALPTTADFIRAAITFWGALLFPIAVGIAVAILAFRRQYTPRWSILETGIVAIPYLTLVAGHISETFIMVASLIVGGTVVMSLLNLGACLRQRMWGKFGLSALVICGGALYPLWLYAFIIYVDT